MRSVFAAFNVGFGGVAGFVRPVIMPMAEGAIVAQGYEPNEEHVEELKGMASGMENITWFFGQVLFVGGSGGLLVQSTLAGGERACPAGCHRDPRVHHCHCGRHRILCDQGSQDDPEVL